MAFLDRHLSFPTFPLLTCGYYIVVSDITFIRLSDEVTIKRICNDVVKIIQSCNGRTSIDIVIERAGLDYQQFCNIVEALCAQGILLSPEHYSLVFHKQSIFPLLIPGATEVLGEIDVSPYVPLEHSGNTHFSSLLMKRQSARGFGEDSLTSSQLSGLLKAMYGKYGNTRSVPSAGGLYDLAIYFYVARSVGLTDIGLYRYRGESHSIEKMSPFFLYDALSVIFDLENAPGKPTVVAFIVGGNTVSNTKYPIRAYRYQLLEAGHIAQNAYLFGAENGIAILERGGFNDTALAAALAIDYPNQFVLTTITVGSLCPHTPKENRRQVDDIASGFSSHVKDIKFGTYTVVDYLMPRVAAFCEYWLNEDREGQTGFRVASGTGNSMASAYTCAIAEAVERKASRYLRIDKVCIPSQADECLLDLSELSPQSTTWRERKGLHTFALDDPREWVRGEFAADERSFLAPIDQVFFPLDVATLNRRPAYVATSSGVAAHTNKTNATIAAVCELIERDAICAHWYGRAVPQQIPPSFFTINMRDRMTAFTRRTGAVIRILNLTLDTWPVVVVIIESTLGGITAGAACNHDWEAAGIKALDEAELLFHLKRDDAFSGIAVGEVDTVQHHADFWWNPQNRHNLSWLFKGVIRSPAGHSRISFSDILKKFQIGLIEKRVPNYSGSLRVFRAISPQLIPITFGYGSQHTSHPRYDLLGFTQPLADAPPHFLS